MILSLSYFTLLFRMFKGKVQAGGKDTENVATDLTDHHGLKA